MAVPNTGCTKPNIVHTGSPEISKLGCGELSGVKDHTISDSNDESGSICAFCQSSGVKDVSAISGCVSLFISFMTIDTFVVYNSILSNYLNVSFLKLVLW